jgi:hypothetical protein
MRNSAVSLHRPDVMGDRRSEMDSSRGLVGVLKTLSRWKGDRWDLRIPNPRIPENAKFCVTEEKPRHRAQHSYPQCALIPELPEISSITFCTL